MYCKFCKHMFAWGFVMGLMLIATSCTNEKLDDSPQAAYMDTEIPKDLGGVKIGGFVLPKGTRSKVSEDGSRLDFTLPKNYVFSMKDSSGKVSFTQRGSYTCTSNCDGCDVVLLGDEVGCSSCPEGSTEPCVGKWVDKQKSNIDKSGSNNRKIVGMIDLSKGIRFYAKSDKKPLNKLPGFDVLMEHPKVKQDFDAFVQSIWNGRTPDPAKAKMVLVDMYGEVIALYVPKDFLNKTANKAAEVVQQVSCNCDSGNSGCDLEEIYKGFILVGYRCKAEGTSACTMNGIK